MNQDLQSRIDELLAKKRYTGTPFKVKVFEGTTYVYKEGASEEEQVFLEDDIEERVLAFIWATDEIDNYFICDGVVVTKCFLESLEEFCEDDAYEDFFNYVKDFFRETGYTGEGRLNMGRREYLVLTDKEANKKFKERQNEIINDFVLPEIPQQYRPYFKHKKYRKDVLKGDGRGPTLAGYDGEELEKMVNGTFYYIYRTN